jgi:hypothetical protein
VIGLKKERDCLGFAADRDNFGSHGRGGTNFEMWVRLACHPDVNLA